MPSIAKLLGLLDEGTSFRVRPQTIKGLSNVEGGAEAVARLQKEFDVRSLQDGNLFFEPKITDDMVRQVEAEIGTLTDQERALNDYGYKYANGEVPGGESPIAHALNTSATVSGITLPSGMLKDWKKLHQTADVINARMMPKTFNFLPSTKDWDGAKIKGSIWHVISNPKQAFGELTGDLVTKPTELKFLADKFGKHSRKIYKNLTKKLSNKEIDTLNGVMRASNDSEEVFAVHRNGLVNKSGDVFEVSEGIVEAYYGNRMLLDHMYWLNNGAAVRQAQAKGFKLMARTDGDQLVREIKGRHGEIIAKLKDKGDDAAFVKWSKELDQDGYRVVEIQGHNGQIVKVALTPEESGRLLKDVPDTHPVIPYREGYVPVIYTDQWAIGKLTKMKDGTYRSSRVATAPTIVKANKAVETFGSGNKLAEDEIEAIFIASRKNDVSTDLAYGENLHNIIDNLSPGELKSMKKALRDMGLDDFVVDSLEKTGRFFSHKRNPYMMKRGPRLKDWRGVSEAEILPADEAIQKYLQSSSSYSASAEYLSALQGKFMDEFGELLTDSNDFLSPIRSKTMGTASNGRTAMEARLVRGQINRLGGLTSDIDRIADNFIIASLDKMHETRIGKLFDRLLDSMSEVWGIGRFIGTPSLARSVASTKGFTATAKLGLWNPSQAIVQGTAALNVIGKNPITAFKATKDMMQAIVPEIMKIGRTVKGRKLYEAIDNSGFIAGFDYVELQRVAAKGTDKILGSRMLRSLVNTNLYPYQLGEGGVRALAWFTERRILIDMISDGLEGFTKADIDTVRFSERVNAAASITALNMSRVNQPLISRGLIGVPFQFKQFLIQQAEFMFNPKNFRTRREMLTTWGAWVGIFGIQGMPWMFDLAIYSENGFAAGAEALEAMGIDTASPKYIGAIRRTAQEHTDNFAKMAAKSKAGKLFTDVAHAATFGTLDIRHYDDARAFWNRWAQSGVVSAMTDGEFNIASRASLARVLTEYYGNQSLDDTLFGPGYQTAVMLIQNNVTNINDIVNIWRNGDEFTPEYILSAGQRATRGLPGLQHPIQAAEMWLNGEWRDTERRLIADDPSLIQVLLVGAGFSPGKRGERFERLEFTQRQKKAWKEWAKGRQQRIARLSQEGHIEYATVLLNDSLTQIQKVNPMIAKEFLMSYSHEMLRRNLTASEQEFLYRHQDAEFFDSSYDKFFFGRDTYMNWGKD